MTCFLLVIGLQRVPAPVPLAVAAAPAVNVHTAVPNNQLGVAPVMAPTQLNPVDLLQQQISLQRQLESLQQEGRNQMDTLQKSLANENFAQVSQLPPSALQQQQPIPSALQQQQPIPSALQQQQPVLSALQQQLDFMKRKELQSAAGQVRSEPAAVQSNASHQQSVLPIKLFGVGIFFATDANGGQVVRSFVPAGPAERSGQVSIGDVIVSVDNTDVYGLPLATLAKYLLGPRGSQINMGFCKPHDKTVRWCCSAISASPLIFIFVFRGASIAF
jgi:C-terminal processing protease CtpA/Prc